jgi:hypothetical protein
MHDWQSLSHVRWERKYHLVIIPSHRGEARGRTHVNGPGVVILMSTPPTGATSRERPPRGGHPNASAYGRG